MTGFKYSKIKATGVALSALCVALFASQASADFVINDDLIVDGSACIGFDCVNGEVFSFDTIRLKENNLRIKFDDTSVAASFPRTDWQITVNDSANGGQGKFSIEDISGSRVPFTIEANARTHSLYVDDGGRIGNRTSTPSVEFHTIDGDTPTVRLQQDGSSGFAPQSWDLAGNETNFFVRDVTNGSTLPFRIRPGAPTSSIFIDTDGDVALGSASPDASLHITTNDVDSNDEDGILLVENTSGTEIERDMAVFRNNGDVELLMTNTAAGAPTEIWKFGNNAGEFRILTPTNPGREFSLTNTGELTINGAIITGGGTCGGGCDAVFDADHDLPSIEEHAALMWENKYLPNVGPTPEGAPINVSDKVGRMLNELEKAHIYIEQLHNRLEKLEADAAAQ